MKNQKKISVVEAFNSLKRIVKDDYMLNVYENGDASIENLQRSGKKFDNVFLNIQMKMIIIIAGLAIGFILYYYFRFKGLHFLIAFPLTLLLSYLFKRSLELLAIALIRRNQK